ncbi:MBL fold metallo-hydrolase [Alsobacter sp. SYSU M60028]|uniref:MBL fold metallo-hydrolase n=1 Tax=Alsobacter ponti TaxID=2962936 RepID=A0ABT1LDZ2_9HYPH|nr:MBL fold metallo-hydrolase [Alsobacter ponti]MCP8939721.1 MBL fold metallo-hydrolase [Alsobacter ponti]
MPQPQAAIVPVTPFQQNCTLVWDKDTMTGAVVDPGGDLPLIRDAIRNLGVTVEKILLTHGHIDHAAGAAELAAELGVAIEGPHRADQFLLDKLDMQGQSYGILGARNCTPDRWLDQGDVVTVGGLTFDVLHCPGHSPGSVVFVNRDATFALVGDVLFAGSIGRTDLPGGDHETLLTSIRERLLPIGDDYAFICGHGPTSTIGKERATNPFLA